MEFDFKTAFTSIIGRQASNNRATSALQHMVLPILIGLLGFLSPVLWIHSQAITISAWIGLSIIYGLIWWKSHPTYHDAYRLLAQKNIDDERIEKLSDEINELKVIVEDLYFKNIIAFAMRGMSIDYVNYIRRNGLNKDYFNEMIDELMAPFYLSGDVIFGFKISEKWSISLYLHNKKDNLLKCVWRKTSPTHPSAEKLGRDWLPGEGHVGKAFLDRKPILTGNANDDAVAQLCRARDSRMTEYDSATYVSFASVPITVVDDDAQDPYGVLVVTSDEVDRLSEESLTEMLMHVAETIAIILELSDADTNCVIDPNQAS